MAKRSSGNQGPGGRLAFYVTSHGFGHLNRTGNAFFAKALAARLCPLLGREHSASLAPK